MGYSIEWIPLVPLLGERRDQQPDGIQQTNWRDEKQRSKIRARRPAMLTANNVFVNETTIKNTPASRQTGRGKLLLKVRQIGGKAASPFVLRQLQLQTTTRHHDVCFRRLWRNPIAWPRFAA